MGVDTDEMIGFVETRKRTLLYDGAVEPSRLARGHVVESSPGCVLMCAFEMYCQIP